MKMNTTVRATRRFVWVAFSSLPPIYRKAVIRLKSNDESYLEISRLFERRPGSGYSVSAMTEKEFLFIHVPKAAGLSVIKAMTGGKGAGHKNAATFLAWLGASEFDRLCKIGVVRNPFSRAYSAYKFFKKGGLSKQDSAWARQNIRPNTSFDEFICRQLKARKTIRHLLPASYFLNDPRTGTSCLDITLRFESLAVDFAALPAKFRRRPDLPASNSSGGPDFNGSLLSRETSEMIQEYYREDFLQFNYPLEPTLGGLAPFGIL